MAETVFQRYEKKYLISESQLKEFIERSKDLIHPDEYGSYTISNIYYDSENNECIRTSIEKPVYKEKLRIRTYQADQEDPITFVELKKKVDGVVYKRRVMMRLFEATQLCSQSDWEGSTQIEKEIHYFVKHYRPVPKVYIAYDRIAYTGHGGLRITVDKDIRYRTHDLSLKPSAADRASLPERTFLVEIKTPTAFPVELSKILSDLKIYPVSYSKAGNIYKSILSKKEA